MLPNSNIINSPCLIIICAGLLCTIGCAGAGFNEDISSMKNCRSYRASSYDKSGGNTDYWWVQPGQSRDILNVKAPGCVKHIWMTTPSKKCSATWYQGSLETTMIRMYWDGEKQPSVDVPLGIFFCCPFDTTREFVSKAVVVAPYDGRGFNMYFPMPFSKSARIELVNYSKKNKFRIYFHINYVLYHNDKAVSNKGRFHARYRKEKLVRGKDHVILDTKGRGQYAGTVIAIDTGIRGDRNKYTDKYPGMCGAWWEGDETFVVDGKPVIHGTGTEDYFGSSWSYADGQAFCAPEFGAAMCGYHPRDYGRWCLYHWHFSNPIAFQKSLKFSIEHGHDNLFVIAPYQSVAYWYQQEPHQPYPLYEPDADDISEPLTEAK